ncbi:tyrosine-type recombinase/integrase [Labrys monachus]|uniref:Integrase n=1 Tax=Labrys monachus TaxID=217067 RepID=A0ABU0FKQ9_9HYPH|nr:site-specific integrase [Labrys monachus]MDQ0395198.1 integrase [Labrys monachus]
MGNNLTQVAIDNLRPGPARREIPDGKVRGLYLVVQPARPDGERRLSWAFRYRINGKPAKFTIGPYLGDGLGLAEARKKAERLRAQVADGVDPASEKKETRKAAEEAGRAERDTVEKIASSFIDRYAKPNTRESSWREYERILNREVVPLWKKRSVQDIAKRDVIDLLDGIVDRGAPVQANRVLAVVRKLFNWCVERGILQISPCAGLKAPTGETSRDRVLSDIELRLVWNAAEGQGWPFGPLAQLLLLTGQRREEVAGMQWSEVDLDKALWTIPKERAKNGVAHEVPLSAPAVEILRKLPKISGKKGAVYVFTTTGETPVSGYAKAKRSLDKSILEALRRSAADAGGNADKIGEPERWTFHDLRRTMASGMARLGINLPVIEKILNHVSGSFGGIVGVYQRHSFSDEKRAALETWGRFVAQLVADTPTANVVPIRVAHHAQ